MHKRLSEGTAYGPGPAQHWVDSKLDVDLIMHSDDCVDSFFS